MRRIVETEGGLEGLLGERVTLFCMSYIYTGKLTGVDDTSVELEEAAIVYETGELTTPKWTDAQPLPHTWYVMKRNIESFGVLKT
jgi:hypothetical protein